jgi:hypothetical protein
MGYSCQYSLYYIDSVDLAVSQFFTFSKLAKKEMEILRKFAEETSDSIEVKKEESL